MSTSSDPNPSSPDMVRRISKPFSLLNAYLNPVHLTCQMGKALPLLAGLLVIPRDAGRVWLIESLVQLGNFLLIIALIKFGFFIVRWAILDRQSVIDDSSKVTDALADFESPGRVKQIKEKQGREKQAQEKQGQKRSGIKVFIDGPLFARIVIILGGLIVLQAIGLADYRAPYSSTAQILIFAYIATQAIEVSLGNRSTGKRLKPVALTALKVIRIIAVILASATFVNGAFIPRFSNLIFILPPLTGILFIEAGIQGWIARKRSENLCLASSAMGVVLATFPPITSFTAILPPSYLVLLGFPFVFDMIRKQRPHEVNEYSFQLMAHTVNIVLFIIY